MTGALSLNRRGLNLHLTCLFSYDVIKTIDITVSNMLLLKQIIAIFLLLKIDTKKLSLI